MVHPNGPNSVAATQHRGSAFSDLPLLGHEVVHIDPEARCEMPDARELQERDEVLLLPPLLVG